MRAPPPGIDGRRIAERCARGARVEDQVRTAPAHQGDKHLAQYALGDFVDVQQRLARQKPRGQRIVGDDRGVDIG
ncbi:hypothetical protein, partial [Mesorhizobium sp. M2A.F.Ca.ET.015.02.1.1]|uniref:hypothetical protein n=1 Tax=Mesorhizobium sp. M2A.F.Ca.ET.015.02.1.1 TaxID=2496758 RepID=UPI001FE14413